MRLWHEIEDSLGPLDFDYESYERLMYQSFVDSLSKLIGTTSLRLVEEVIMTEIKEHFYQRFTHYSTTKSIYENNLRALKNNPSSQDDF